LETSRRANGPTGQQGNRVAIALGSNLGDREANLTFGLAALPGFLTHLKHSRWHETVAEGVPSDQPHYLNGVVIGETELSPRELLDRLLHIEREAGRTRPSLLAPRTLDLDLILFGDKKIEEPGLVVPHPRFRERLFVLEPLAEVAPEWVDPHTGLTVSALLLRERQARSGPS
jgi:2-amino-4-hydroxy-6-hydroxymethyldihydropteridine diphosphokinase